MIHVHREIGTGAAMACLRERTSRMLVLLAVIVTLSLADLLMTLIYLRSMGMSESNPIAAWLIVTTGSWRVLVAYKALTVLICVSLLYRLRSHIEGEIAAWCAAIILAGLAIVWNQYADIDAASLPAQVAISSDSFPRWHRLD